MLEHALMIILERIFEESEELFPSVTYEFHAWQNHIR